MGPFQKGTVPPTVSAEIATRLRDVQVGADVQCRPLSRSIESYSVGVSLDRAREKISVQALTGFSTFVASYHQRFNEQLEVAYRATWDAKTTGLGMEVGAKYALFNGGFLKVRTARKTAACFLHFFLPYCRLRLIMLAVWAWHWLPS